MYQVEQQEDSIQDRVLRVAGLYAQISGMIHSLCVTWRDTAYPGEEFMADFDSDMNGDSEVVLFSLNGREIIVSLDGLYLVKPKKGGEINLMKNFGEAFFVVKTSLVKDEIVEGKVRITLKITDIGVSFPGGQFISSKCHD